MPKRIQRKRTKGWRLPDGVVYVGRGSKLGNPYKVIKKKTGGFSVKLVDVGRKRRTHKVYEQHFPDKRLAIENSMAMYRKYTVPYIPGLYLHNLKSKDLACWCPLDQPCHADVLLELANK